MDFGFSEVESVIAAIFGPIVRTDAEIREIRRLLPAFQIAVQPEILTAQDFLIEKTVGSVCAGKKLAAEDAFKGLSERVSLLVVEVLPISENTGKRVTYFVPVFIIHRFGYLQLKLWERS